MDQLPDDSVIIVDMNVENIELFIEQFPEKYRVILYSGSLELMDIPIHLQSTGCRYFNAFLRVGVDAGPVSEWKITVVRSKSVINFQDDGIFSTNISY